MNTNKQESIYMMEYYAAMKNMLQNWIPWCIKKRLYSKEHMQMEKKNHTLKMLNIINQ